MMPGNDMTLRVGLLEPLAIRPRQHLDSLLEAAEWATLWFAKFYVKVAGPNLEFGAVCTCSERGTSPAGLPTCIAH